MERAPDRVVSLDLIRGVAVLGILAVNIAGFAGPSAATLTPAFPLPPGPHDEATFAAIFLLFDGKMRTLFTMLFGASMLLFIDRVEASGRNGEFVQLRRLAWLAMFGMLHYFLFWWGDILFLYAAAGLIALPFRQMPPRRLLVGAVLAYICWHLTGGLTSLAGVMAEDHVRLGMAGAKEAAAHDNTVRAFAQRAARELAEYRLGFLDQIAAKLTQRPFWLIETGLPSLGETVPLMLIGMALLRSGFFDGTWPRRTLIILATVAGLAGAAITAAMLDWLWLRHFPVRAMSAAFLYWNAVPQLLMALAYAALLVLATPWLTRCWLGVRLIAAGRMAFTNYIATTVVMTAIFYGWGLGLVGTVSHARQPAFVLLGWLLMLGWSAPWLARFRQGPLEWLWRSLTEARLLPFRRSLPASG